MTGMSRRSVLKAGLGTAAVAAAGSTLLSGCGASSGDAPMEFWNFYYPNPLGTPTAKIQGAWFSSYINEWNRKNKQQVKPLYIPNYTGTNKIQTSFAAGAGPDIFMMSPGDFLRYYNGGVLEELSQYMEPEAIADFFPQALSTRSVDGKIYGLPMEQEPLAIFYSQAAWEKAGLSEGDIPKTWDRLLEVGAKLKTSQRAGLVFEANQGYYQNFTWYPWMWQGGGEAIGTGNSSAFDSQGARQALQLFQDAVTRGGAPRANPAAGDTVTAFKHDLAAMWQTGIYSYADFVLREPKFPLGVFPLPTPPGGKATTIAGGWAFVVNKNGRNPEAAARFCVEALGSMSPASIKRVTQWCTVAKRDIAPRKSALEAGTAAGGYDTPIMKLFKDTIYPTARAEPRYPPVIYKAISDAIQNTMLAGKNASAEADTAAQSINAYLKTYEGAKIL